jgi:hypothetical protein
VKSPGGIGDAAVIDDLVARGADVRIAVDDRRLSWPNAKADSGVVLRLSWGRDGAGLQLNDEAGRLTQWLTGGFALDGNDTAVASGVVPRGRRAAGTGGAMRSVRRRQRSSERAGCEARHRKRLLGQRTEGATETVLAHRSGFGVG